MACFFYVTLGCDQDDDLIDIFARRYGWTVPEIEALDVERMASLAKKIHDAEREEELRRQWTAILPAIYTGLMKPVTFDEYKTATSPVIDTRPTEEILTEVEEIRREIREG